MARGALPSEALSGTLPRISLDPILAGSTILHFFLISAWWFFPSGGAGSLFGEADINFPFPSPHRSARVFTLLLVIRVLSHTITILFLLAFYFVIASPSLMHTFVLTTAQKAPDFLLVLYAFLFALAVSGVFFLATAVNVQRHISPAFATGAALVLALLGLLLLGVFGWYALPVYLETQDFWAATVSSLNQPVLVWGLLPFRGVAESPLITYTGFNPRIALGAVIWLFTLVASIRFLISREPHLAEIVGERAQQFHRWMQSRALPRSAAMADAIIKKEKARTVRVRRFPLLER
jgi:hypothetical protein